MVIRFIKYLLLMILCLSIMPVSAANALTAKDLYNQGFRYEQARDYNNVVLYCSKAIELDASYAEAYSMRARAFSAIKEYELAVADYTKCITLEPANFGYYHNRGNFYSEIGEYNLAIADYTRAIEIKETFFSRKARGDTYVKTHQYDLAMRDFNRMAEIWPGDQEVYIYRSQVYGLLGNYSKAIEECNIGLREYPQNPIMLFNVSQAYELLGDKETAIQYYRKAMNKEMAGLYEKKTAMLRNKISARLKGDWESYSDWIYY